ncbi:cell surface protein [Caenimonas sedimenti]
MSIATLVGGMGFVGAASADVIVGTGAAPTSAVLGATTATQLVLAAGGIGHQLITPYFNAQNGNATIISVTNTDTVNGKVMKVRFRGASNSDDILDFTVLMSPGDVWNATVTAPTTTAPAQIVTSDKTCTLPQLAAGVPQQFVTARLTSKSGNDIPNNTREGYIEIFNMADIPSTQSLYDGSAVAKQSNLYTAIKHVAGTPPCTSTAINTAILDTNHTAEATAANRGLATPTTGLFGNWTIINVPQTTTYSGSMVAVRALTAGNVDGRGNFVVFPQSATQYPGVINNVTADPVLRTANVCTSLTAANVCTAAAGLPAIPAAFFDLPDMSTPYAGAATPLIQAGTLTAALAVQTVVNEYATDAIISAKTDWVFSMPTRRYSVAMDYSPATSRRLYSQTLDPTLNLPFFHDSNTRINTGNAQQICVDATAQTFYDREEQTKSSGAVFSPGNISITTFCGETSVLSFADSGVSVLGGTVARQDTSSSAFTNGWGVVNVRSGATNLGLPVMGGSFIKATNPQVAAGQSGTYGVSSEHRFTR